NTGDFKIKSFHDVKVASAGDKCPRCTGQLTLTRGIEVGHIFKLGLKYSKSMSATYLDKDGKEQFMVMGCYGIGVGRTVAAAIEQGNDENGMILPAAIAPFEVNVLPVNTAHSETMALARTVYDELLAKGIDVLLDDRDERPGIKFKDCDLIGIPLRVTIGERNLKEGLVEIKLRTEKESRKVRKEQIVEEVVEHVRKLKQL
ncbi:MAG TPA: His/Gly/Thr/Pro-type tRNA ligase C-terminal domain-containing protein, partial [Syntrophorhabdaceae bacterium]|nr:His/Gly/Thr/Pro-type tRNA ligase C-terminal domain-containing protein [Syntrophorhabdaceae bacterium]